MWKSFVKLRRRVRVFTDILAHISGSPELAFDGVIATILDKRCSGTGLPHVNIYGRTTNPHAAKIDGIDRWIDVDAAHESVLHNKTTYHGGVQAVPGEISAKWFAFQL